MARGRGKLTPQDLEYMRIISANINSMLKSGNFKQIDLSRETGIPASTLTGYVKGTSLPIPGNVQKIADFFNVKKSDIDPRFKSTNITPPTPPNAQNDTLTALNDKVVQLTTPRQKNVLGYATEQLEEQQKEQELQFIDEALATYFTYDFFDQPASAGTGQYLSDSRVEKIELPVEVDADFVIQVDGVSMEPDYLDDDYVFVKLSYNLSNGDIGVFYYNGNAYIKQLRIDGNKAYLHSLNPDYKDMPITEDTDFRMIGKVVDVYREG